MNYLSITKKLLAVLLVAIVIFGMFPLYAFASDLQEQPTEISKEETEIIQDEDLAAPDSSGITPETDDTGGIAEPAEEIVDAESISNVAESTDVPDTNDASESSENKTIIDSSTVDFEKNMILENAEEVRTSEIELIRDENPKMPDSEERIPETDDFAEDKKGFEEASDNSAADNVADAADADETITEKAITEDAVKDLDAEETAEAEIIIETDDTKDADTNDSSAPVENTITVEKSTADIEKIETVEPLTEKKTAETQKKAAVSSTTETVQDSAPVTRILGSYVLFTTDQFKEYGALMENNRPVKPSRRDVMVVTDMVQQYGSEYIVVPNSGKTPTTWTIEEITSINEGLPENTIACYIWVSGEQSPRYLTIGNSTLTLSAQPQIIYVTTRSDGRIRLTNSGGYAVNLGWNNAGKNHSNAPGFGGYKSDTAAENEWFVKARLCGVKLQYVLNSETADPAMVISDEAAIMCLGTSVTLRNESSVSVRRAGMVYHYVLEGWQAEDGSVYAPESVMDISAYAPGSTVTLRAVWKLDSSEELGIEVSYNIKEGPAVGSIAGELPVLAEESTDAGEQNTSAHIVRKLSYNYYRRYDGARHYYTYEFAGWKTESGSVVFPGTTISLYDTDEDGKPIYDTDGDGTAVLTSIWSHTWKAGTQSSGYPTVNYVIYRTVSTANRDIASDVQFSEKTTAYSPVIASAIMHALDENGNVIYSDQLASPSYGGAGAPNYGKYSENAAKEGKYLMITYVGDNIINADRQIRQLAGKEGYHTDDSRSGSVTWQLSYLPSDEEVLASLRTLVASGQTELKDEEDRVIPAEELTTEFFVVRWCYVKYQSGKLDGWHIDGKLTRKVGYITVNKTFCGKAEVINAAITGGFNISLINKADSSDVVILNMTDKTADSRHFGRLSDSSFGYTKKTANSDGTTTYTWVVPCYSAKTFFIKENNYNVELEGTSYGTRAQYSMDSGTRKLWDEDTVIETSTSPSDDPDPTHFGSISFFNTYYPEGDFLIEVVNSKGQGLRNVGFCIYDASGTQIQTLYKEDGSSRYSMLYQSGETTNTVYSDVSGYIYLTLPIPEDTSQTYIIKEIIPEGYYGHNEAGAEMSFAVTISGSGTYYVSDIKICYGRIQAITSASGGNQVIGAQVLNVAVGADVAPTGISLNRAPFALIVAVGVALVITNLITKRRKTAE